jgi:hypothetical protein
MRIRTPRTQLYSTSRIGFDVIADGESIGRFTELREAEQHAYRLFDGGYEREEYHRFGLFIRDRRDFSRWSAGCGRQG